MRCDVRGNGAAESETVMNKERSIKNGDHVMVMDERSVLHDGLVTNCWASGPTKDGEPGPTINVLFVTADESKRDQYGDQIERLSSCSHKLRTTAPGRYWYWPDETF